MTINRERLGAPLGVALAFSLGVPQSAYAYLDPGTGSLIWQVFIALLLSTAVLIRSYWYRIRRFFGKGNDKSAIDSDDEKE